MEAEDILWALPYLILAAVLYSIYLWKTARGRNLLTKAQSLLSSGDTGQAVDLLKQALWKANEKEELERSILAELDRAYRSRSIPFDSHDYVLLIGQFQELKKKGSTKAMAELKKVQALKKKLIEYMPEVS